jgi:cleavage and polyadenylation specificity factor subunit 2
MDVSFLNFYLFQEETGTGDEMDESTLVAFDLSEGKGIIRGRNGRPPMKVLTVPRLLEVLAEIAYIPLEGRVNARAARQSVRALQPRHVVVLGGSARDTATDTAVDEVTLLADSVKSYVTGDRKVLTPSDGDTAELSVGHAAYSVRLIDTPYLSKEDLATREVDEEPPIPVEPFEAQLGECTVSLFDCLATGTKVAQDGSIVLAPRPDSKVNQALQPNILVSNGEVLLTDLRAEMIAEGMKADYKARKGYAQLIVNGKVVVKKDLESGKIGVEGPLCEDFYKVRSIVCGQFVIL